MTQPTSAAQKLPETMEQILDWQLAQRRTTILRWPSRKTKWYEILARAARESEDV